MRRPLLMPRERLSQIEEWTCAAVAERGQVELPADMMAELLQHVAVLEERLEGLDGPWCVSCGCSEHQPCLDDELDPCGWWSHEPPVCTTCAPRCADEVAGPWGEAVRCDHERGHVGAHEDHEANVMWPATPAREG